MALCTATPFLKAGKILKETYQSKTRDDLFFAGQLCGVRRLC